MNTAGEKQVPIMNEEYKVSARLNRKPAQEKREVFVEDGTYLVDGVKMTLEDMLAVKTPCGQQRYGLLDVSVGKPLGTLYDRTNPLRPVMSEEAIEADRQVRRKQEGHRSQPAEKEIVLR